jgi:hypothetical protein
MTHRGLNPDGAVKFSRDPRGVETNASIAQHRQEMEKDPAGGEASKGCHVPSV